MAHFTSPSMNESYTNLKTDLNALVNAEILWSKLIALGKSTLILVIFPNLN